MTQTDPPSSGAADARGLSPVIQPRPIWHWVLLTVSTFGLYLLYWNWMAWSYLRDRHGARVMPLVRSAVDGLLFPIFSYSLFRHLFDAARARGYPESPPAGLLAAALFGFRLLAGQSARFAPFVSLQALPLLPAFETANFLFRTEWPHVPERREFSIAESLVVGFGVFLWVGMINTLLFHPEIVQQWNQILRGAAAP